MHITVFLSFATVLFGPACHSAKAAGVSRSGNVHSVASLYRRLTQEEVCRPPVEEGTDIIPPCASIENIEWQCMANGTEPIYIEAHAQCLCSGSFFQDWIGCRSCLAAHGYLSERDHAKYIGAIESVSSAMCAESATPTDIFPVLFESAARAEPEPTEGSTETGSDSLNGSTAVSLYYTASVSQGPGTITGSATIATATTTLGGSSGTVSDSSDPTSESNNEYNNKEEDRESDDGESDDEESEDKGNGTAAHGASLLAVVACGVFAAAAF